ncbi:MAG: hypothetical protein PVI37_08425 [Gammaproteobacteria bacterium]
MAPVPPHAVGKLQDNQGYLALIFDSLNPIQRVQFVDGDGDDAFLLGRVPEGVSVQVFVLPEGEYCLDSYHSGGGSLFSGMSVSQIEDFCMTVKAGTLNYSDTIRTGTGVRMVDGKIREMRGHELVSYRDTVQLGRLLKDTYPDLYQRYRLAVPGLIADQVIHIPGRNQH